MKKNLSILRKKDPKKKEYDRHYGESLTRGDECHSLMGGVHWGPKEQCWTRTRDDIRRGSDEKKRR